MNFEANRILERYGDMTIYAGIYTVLSNLASKIIYVTLPYLHNFTVKDKSVLFAALANIMNSELSKEDQDDMKEKCTDLYSRNANYFKEVKSGDLLYLFIFNDVIEKTMQRLEVLKAQAGDNVSTDIEETLIFNNIVDIPTIRPSTLLTELSPVFESSGKFSDKQTAEFYTNAGNYFIHKSHSDQIAGILSSEIFYFEKYVKFEVEVLEDSILSNEQVKALVSRQDINLQGLTNVKYLNSALDFYKLAKVSSPIKSITPGLRLMHINRPNLEQMTKYVQALFQKDNTRKALSNWLIHSKAYYLTATVSGKAMPINAVPIVSIEGSFLDGFDIVGELDKSLPMLKDKMRQTEEYKLFFNYLFPLEKIISMNNAHLVSNLFNIYKEVRSKNSIVKAFDDALTNSSKALLNESDKPIE